MSPAVITETVWALAREAEPVIPSRVIAVTTSEGRRQIEQVLFSPDPRLDGRSPWDSLRAALEALGHDLTHRLRFGTTADDVRVITAAEASSQRSRELPDIRTPADNEAAADFLLEQVRAIVENPDTHLIASVAGGRKTMGALLYACLTLAGRETDRLTHVLVSEPFDTLRDFFFPGQPGGELTDREGRRHAPSGAQVDLADVPFIPLRNLFVRELGRKAGTFLRLVENCREEVRRAAGEKISLTIDQSRCQIDVNGTRVTLAPREHLVVLFLANRAKRGEPPFAAQKEAVESLNDFRVALVKAAPAGNFADWRHGDSLRSAIEEPDIRKAMSSLRSKLLQARGNAPPLLSCLPQKGRFSLEVVPSLIHLK